MILEAAMLQVKQGMENEFEETFKKASAIISSMNGYVSHTLHKCMEEQGKYLLLVNWETLEDHTIGFRESLVLCGIYFAIHFIYTKELYIQVNGYTINTLGLLIETIVYVGIAKSRWIRELVNKINKESNT